MPTGFAEVIASEILTAFTGGTPFAIDDHWVMAHHGDPGAAGTLFEANGGQRVLVPFAGTPTVTGGVIELASTGAANWTNWTGGTTFPTHASSWSAETGGRFQASAIVVPDPSNPPVLGGTVTIPAGGIVLRLRIASA